VRPYYTHQPNSPRHLSRALSPSALRGCVNPARVTQQSRMPLPRVQQRQTYQGTSPTAHNPMRLQWPLATHKLSRT
jgi:hypothetical protein